MRKDYEKLFTHLETPEPPAGLFAKIMARIHEEERLLSIKRRFFSFLNNRSHIRRPEKLLPKMIKA